MFRKEDVDRVLNGDLYDLLLVEEALYEKIDSIRDDYLYGEDIRERVELLALVLLFV